MIEATRVVVGDSATCLIDATGTDPTGGASAVLIPATGTAIVFVGGEGVTAEDGAAWSPALGPLSISLQPGEVLWAVRAEADPDQEIHVLAMGK